MSDAAIAVAIVVCASASGQSLARWSVSNEPDAGMRAVAMAAKQASRAASEIAIEMPKMKTCAAAISACGSCAAPSRLAAAAAEEAEVMARGVVGDEVDGGKSVAVAAHAAVVDAFLAPHRAQHRAVDVVAERGDVAGARALARRGDSEVRGVAAEPLEVETPLGRARLVELDHRLAESEDVHGGHVAIAT